MTIARKRLLPLLEKKIGPFNFAMFVRAARTHTDLSQADMARALGIARGTLCDIEKGRQSVSIALAVKIARKAGLSEEQAIMACLDDQLKRAKIPYKVQLKKTA